MRGADTFVFGRGRDVIEDFGADDVIELENCLGVASFDDIVARSITIAGGDDVLIDFGNGNTLQLEDVTLLALSSEDFVFV